MGPQPQPIACSARRYICTTLIEVNLGRKRLGLSAQQQYEFNVTDANAVTTLFVQSFGIGQDRKREDFG
jgi:hypothetical protein